MAEGKLLPYLDIPFQHASPRVLKAMRRPAASENNLARIRAWREVCPEIAIRSTFIVGFPGESDAEFEELLDFLDEARLDRVGAFAYSPVTGAAANALDGAVPEALKEERLARFMERQAAISAEILAEQVGTRQVVILDEVGVVEGADGEAGAGTPSGTATAEGLPAGTREIAIGRTARDAPEIDGVVRIDVDGYDLAPGDLIEVDIVGADAHDLVGRVPSQSSA